MALILIWCYTYRNNAAPNTFGGELRGTSTPNPPWKSSEIAVDIPWRQLTWQTDKAVVAAWSTAVKMAQLTWWIATADEF